MTVCGVCGCQEFYLHDGKYYCQECNTQTGEREEVIEDKEGTVVYGRQVKTASQQSFQVENFESWLTVEAFNIILKKQVEALINLGSSGNLMHTVLQLWAKYLNKCEMAFVTNEEDWFSKLSTIPRYRDYEVLSDNVLLSGYAGRERNEVPWESVSRNGRRVYYSTRRKRKSNEELKPIKRRKKSKMTKETDLSKIIESTLDCESSSNADFLTEDTETDFSINDEKDDDMEVLDNFSQLARNKLVNMSEKSKMKFWNSRHSGNSVDALMLLHTICFCYAGILINQDHITLSDLLRWIHDGEIPYANAWTVLPKNMLPQKSDYRIFATNNIPSESRVNRMTWKILKFVGMKFVPSKPIEMLTLRIISELNLPLILVKCIRQLVYKGPPSLRQMFTYDWICEEEDAIKTYTEKNKELGALSLCIIVLKIIFGLDGRREIRMSKAACLANKKCSKYFVFEEWLESIRLSLNFIKAVHPTEFKFNDSKPTACIDVDVFRNHMWRTSSIKEEKIQQVHLYKGKNVKRKKNSNVESEKASEVSSEEEGFSIKMRIKRTNTSKVDVNVNLRKILISLINDSARDISKATSFPLSTALNHRLLNDNPNSLVKRDFSHCEILTIESKSSDLTTWKQKVSVSNLELRENYKDLPVSFQTICDFSTTVFNFSQFELCKAVNQIDSWLMKWKP